MDTGNPGPGCQFLFQAGQYFSRKLTDESFWQIICPSVTRVLYVFLYLTPDHVKINRKSYFFCPLTSKVS